MSDNLTETFVNESKENITQLNNALLTLESNPDDEEAIDSIFRQAHTLKGNFGAMGYEQASEVAHAIEDLLDGVREGTLRVTPDRMDLVFAGVDELSKLLADIEDHGEERGSSSVVVDRLRDAAEATGDGTDTPTGRAATDDGPEPDEGGGEPLEVEGVPVTSETSTEQVNSAVDALSLESERELPGDVVAATFGVEAGGMKGADASLAVDQLRADTTVVGSVPPTPDIERGDFDGEVTVYLEERDAAEVARTLSDAWAVTEPRVTAVTDAVEVPQDGATDVSSDAPDTQAASTPEGDVEAAPDAANAAPDVESIEDVQSVRVDVETLDELHETVEQLVTSRIKLREALDSTGDAADALEEVDKVSSRLQGTVMDMRLIPLKKVFDKFPRLVRDVSRSQGKQVDFDVRGEGIELDRTIIDDISDPLMHTLRNAVDHGIESPEEREAAGKSPTGDVRLRARREQDTVYITVEDDGRGLDRDALVDKAVDEGALSREELAQWSDEEVYDLIFHPGLSTNEEVTDVSGRGVGLDVVKTTVESLDGTVDVESTPGEGTTITLELPVSVAIVRVLFVEVGDQRYGLPIKYIDEISAADGVKTMNGEEAITYEGDIYPLVRLREALEKGTRPDDVTGETSGMVLRIRESERQVALLCDDVTRQEEVVITPLQGVLRDVEGISGTSVIGDGHVILILDPNTLPIPGGEHDTLTGSLAD